MKKILVTGATGFQGKAVAEILDKNNYLVSGLTTGRSEDNHTNYELVEGNFSDTESIERSLGGVDGVYFALPLIFERVVLLEYTKNFIEAAKKQKPQLIVFNSSIYVPGEPTGILAFDIKMEIEGLLKQSGLPIIYLHPRVFLDNIAAPWSVPAIVNQGILPYPISSQRDVSWISHYDLARFVTAAFEHPEFVGKTFEIGADKISGEEMVATLSNILGHPIQYVAVDPDDFEKELSNVFDSSSAKAISDIYRYLDKNPGGFQVSDVAGQQLGVKPVSFEEWSSMVPWKVLNEQFSKVRAE